VLLLVPDQGAPTDMLAYTYPLLNLFLTMLEFFLFFLWIWLLIVVFSDIFRSHDLGGFAKAIWVLFVIIIPYLGVLIYLIARGGSMHERAEESAKRQQRAFDDYVKQTAGSSDSSVDQLAKLADLKSKGVISDAEFDAQKAKLLS
jgi:ABC-type multidrug transport system fused ATPase/permease subunit